MSTEELLEELHKLDSESKARYRPAIYQAVVDVLMGYQKTADMSSPDKHAGLQA